MSDDEEEKEPIEYWPINMPRMPDFKKKDDLTKKKSPPPDDNTNDTKEKRDPEYRIKMLECVKPANGWQQNCTFKVRGEVERLISSDKKYYNPYVRVTVTTEYNGKKEDLGFNVSAAIKEDNTFECEIRKLWYHDTYLRDNKKAANATFSMTPSATGQVAEKNFTGTVLQLPQESDFIVLQWGNYDDIGCKNYPDKCVKDGKGYIAGTSVYDMQNHTFNKLRFGLKAKPDGDFGDVTKRIIEDFQAASMMKTRKKKGKIIEDYITFNGNQNGKYDKETSKEAEHWYQQSFVKPDPEYYKGDYDEAGVRNGKGRADGPDFLKGTPIRDFQQYLTDVDADPGNQDGWFADKTYVAVTRFQDFANRGVFISAAGESVELEDEEKLTGHKKGVVCAETLNALKSIIAKKLKIPKSLLTDSVGQGGKNNPEDVKLVKQKLKDLEYPIDSVDEKLTEKDIKTIKFFQIAIKKIRKGRISIEDKSVDGKIDKGGQTDTALFSNNPPKDNPPTKGQEKELQAAIKKKKDDAIAGADAELKKYWENIMAVWKEVSPYLPEGTTMASGFRTKEEQRDQLDAKYKYFEKDICNKYTSKEWKKNIDERKNNLTEIEKNSLDIIMHTQICQAVNPNEVALPGKSKHEQGNAIDSQTSNSENRIRCLLWYQTEFSDKIHILNITLEANGCGHFEFKQL